MVAVKNQTQKSLAITSNLWLKSYFKISQLLNRPGLVGLKNSALNNSSTVSNKAQSCHLSRSGQQPTKTSKPSLMRLLTAFILLQPVLVNSAPLSTTITTAQATTNELDQHPSPYLAMHGKDPIQWQLWNADVLKKAQAENKPLFISSGYFSCHWCHVMQRENYHNALTADYLNKHFISVKIDRELNPELDKVLLEFAQKATGQAGWPQHVILTPEGNPFAAFIYLPNPIFNNTLQRIVELWKSEPDKIRLLAKQSIETPNIRQKLTVTHSEFSDRLLQQLDRAKDDFSGGLKSSASKFPQAPILQAVLNIDNLPLPIEEWLLLTLNQMQSQHLFDHIHGGFYRYTVDPEWQTPHFEKMAYTNALLANIYLQAGLRFKRPDYLQTAEVTLNYLQKHLYNPATQLYQSSQSAIDAHNVEGGDYLWTKFQLQQTLTATEFKTIDQAWSLSKPAPYDQLGWHPMPLTGKNSELWPDIRTKLHTDPTQIPVDSKSILGWNGLILSALSRAYAVLKNPTYLRQANQLAKILMGQIMKTHPPRALSVNRLKMGEANLQDYAFIYQGMVDWQAQTSQTTYQIDIRKLEQTIVQRFYTESGWQYHHAPLLPGQQGEWLMADNAIPSPTALVSCLTPGSMDFAGQALLNTPLNYVSYLKTLDCIQTDQKTANNVK